MTGGKRERLAEHPLRPVGNRGMSLGGEERVYVMSAICYFITNVSAKHKQNETSAVAISSASLEAHSLCLYCSRGREKKVTKIMELNNKLMAERDGKGGRGFASMDPQKQREIASKGGKAAHDKGTAHEFTPEEAREAGRKGGRARTRKLGGGEEGME